MSEDKIHYPTRASGTGTHDVLGDPGVVAHATLARSAPSAVADVAKVRKISEEQAKKEISALVKEHDGMDAFEIAIELDLDVKFTTRLCDELASCGAISAEPVAETIC